MHDDNDDDDDEIIIKATYTRDDNHDDNDNNNNNDNIDDDDDDDDDVHGSVPRSLSHPGKDAIYHSSTSHVKRERSRDNLRSSSSSFHHPPPPFSSLRPSRPSSSRITLSRRSTSATTSTTISTMTTSPSIPIQTVPDLSAFSFAPTVTSTRIAFGKSQSLAIGEINHRNDLFMHSSLRTSNSTSANHLHPPPPHHHHHMSNAMKENEPSVQSTSNYPHHSTYNHTQTPFNTHPLPPSPPPLNDYDYNRISESPHPSTSVHPYENEISDLVYFSTTNPVAEWYQETPSDGDGYPDFTGFESDDDDDVNDANNVSGRYGGDEEGAFLFKRQFMTVTPATSHSPPGM